MTESWLDAYEKALNTEGLTQFDLRRLNPAPRLMVLIEIGVLTEDHPGVTSLRLPTIECGLVLVDRG
ncbi:MAG: hypothetical protein HC938_07760 [Nitrospira sp.]|nr:hypothetical protein [Nitrospira sp.]